MAEDKTILNNIERVKDLLNNRTNKQMTMSEIMQNMPVMSEDDVDIFLTTCRHQRLYDCVILAAVRYDRIEQMLHFKSYNLQSVLRHLLQGDLLVDLAAENWWPCWKGLLSRCTESGTSQLFLWISQNPVNSEALTVFQMLLGRFSSDRPLLRVALEYVIFIGLISHYESLLYSDSTIIQQIVLDYWGQKEHIEGLVTKKYMSENPLCKRLLKFTGDYNGLLVATCEAGLLSVTAFSTENDDWVEWLDWNHSTPMFFAVDINQPKWLDWNHFTPMFYAVKFNQPDLVQFLYSTGMVSNRDVFWLSRDPVLVERCKKDMNREDADPPSPAVLSSQEDGQAARTIRSFLVDKASQVRSLQSLCLAEVSKHVGWGHVRKAAVKQLEIPRNLKDDLMHNCDRALLKYKSK